MRKLKVTYEAAPLKLLFPKLELLESSYCRRLHVAASRSSGKNSHLLVYFYGAFLRNKKAFFLVAPETESPPQWAAQCNRCALGTPWGSATNKNYSYCCSGCKRSFYSFMDNHPFSLWKPTATARAQVGEEFGLNVFESEIFASELRELEDYLTTQALEAVEILKEYDGRD